MNLSEKKLNIYYSFLQIAYWVTSAVVFCFTTVFLQFRGYSNYEIGIVFAVGNIIGFVSQPLIAGYIDRSDRRTLLRCIRITAVLAVLLMLAVYFLPSGSISLIGVYALLVAGNTLLNPLCISLSFYIESWGCGINFSRARALGSLSFAACNVILGMLVQRVSENAVPTAFILFSSLLGLATLLFVPVDRAHRIAAPERRMQSASEKPSGLLEFARENKRFMLFLLGTATLYFTHGMIGNFMIEFIRSIGGGSEDMGNVLAFMTVVEVPVMLLFGRLTQRFRCSSLLRFAVIMFTVKELMIYLASSLPALYAAEALQAFSFALFVPASVRYVDEVIAKHNAVKGQAFVTSMMTLGSIFASYIGGLLLDTSTPGFTLLVGVIVSAVGTLIMLGAIQTTEN
jgi:PPP family 3-phenylpropionic acid transporter